MTYLDHTLLFSSEKLTPEFIDIYLSRYSDAETGWAGAHWDDTEHTRRRKASLFDGTIAPTPHYTQPEPVDADNEWRATHLDGHIITIGWPEAFIQDLHRDPQPEAELFSDIVILS